MTTNRQIRPTVDLGYPTEPHGKIPAFNSIEEEAEFWDTHDFTDFSELTPDDFTDELESGSAVLLKLAPADRDELDRRAEEMGVEPSTLVRMWIEERLRREAS